VEVDCALSDGTACTDAVPPMSGTGAGCTVDATYTYSITNVGDDSERVYSIQVIRAGLTTSIGDVAIEETVLIPGQSFQVTSTEELDICGPTGNDVFALSAFVFSAPPIDVDIVISCVSEDGRECATIGVTTDPDLCLIDVTYTYTITNTGFADTQFQSFSRTRNGETVDLIVLVDDPLLPIGASTSFQETEEIDTCIEQDFTTTTRVIQAPSDEILCSDEGTYP
jgi:hypothetical protein